MHLGTTAAACVLWALCLHACSGAAFEATIAIDPESKGVQANRMLLGSNVQWVDGGDGLVATRGADQRATTAVRQAATALRPTTLRYPGGSQSDTYRWRDGIGPNRGRSTHFFSHQEQEVMFGTDEFLSLAESLGAKPMLTVNLANGTAEDAAEWIHYVNGAKRSADRAGLPRVAWWELGNEPYLKPDSQPDLVMTPDQFVRRTNEFIPAMRAADPSILIGVPLRSDSIGGRPATPFPGYNEKVLHGIKAQFDFVSVHDAYAPAVFDGHYSDGELYLALMAAPLQVAEDLAATRAAVRNAIGHELPIAITEWSALFTIGGNADGYVASLAGALYAADFIRMLAQEPGILVAHYWSWTGNGYFGAVSQSGRRRPVYYMLGVLNEVLRGEVLPSKIAGPMLTTPAVGYVARRGDVGAVTALATRDGTLIRILAINKHPIEPAALHITGLGALSAIYHVMIADSPFAGRDDQPEVKWSDAPIDIEGKQAIRATLPPHSAGFISVELDKRL